MTSQALDARGPFYFIVSLAIVPVLAAILARFVVPYFERVDTRPWAIYSSAGALLLGLWSSLIRPAPFWWVLLAPLVAVGAILSLRFRNPGFTSRDAILFPAWLTAYFGLLDQWRALGYVQTVWVAAALVFGIRLLVRSADSFFLAPVGMVFLIRSFDLGQRTGGGLALVFAFLSPLLIDRLRIPQKQIRRVVAYAIYPLVVMTYPWVTSLSITEGHPRASLFEEGHGLMPASEMLRGETLYRDVTPGHGALSDGLIDYFALRVKGETLGDAIRLRGIIATLNPLGVYFIGLAATGSPELAMLLGFFTWAYLRNSLLWIRSIPSFFCLAFTIAATRLRRVRWFAWAGALVVLAFITSIEFGTYSAAVMLVAVICVSDSVPTRLRAARWAAAGFAAALVPVLIILTACGVLGAFFRVTFGEVLVLGPAYNIGSVTFPQSVTNLQTLPEALTLLLDVAARPYVMWCVVAIVTATIFATHPFVIARRLASIFLTGCWILATGISYAERHHLYFDWLMPVFLISSVVLLARGRTSFARAAAVILTGLLIVGSHPTTMLTVASIVRISKGPLDPNFGEYTALPRAQGALLRRSDFPQLDAAKRFIETLGPGETYFDFANFPLLYFLVDKPSPIRQYEVPFFEPENLQREVVARLERDQAVQAALITFPLETNTIDGVPNEVRAPLVWAYLQANFQPAFDEAGVVFWRRK